MLAIAKREDDEFLSNKIVADFGCDPRGSLAWIKEEAFLWMRASKPSA